MISWRDFVDENYNIPVMDEEAWSLVCSVYSCDKVIDSLTYWLVDNINSSETIPKIPDTIKTIEESRKRFKKLYNDDLKNIWLDEKAIFSSEYENIGDCLGVLNTGYYYNYISDYFQRENRMKCGRYSKYSPYSVLTGTGTDNHKKILRQTLSGLKYEKKLDYMSYRTCMRLGSNVYTAPQFRVQSAKQLYQYFNAKKIVDFSSGWGDRLAAFFCTPGTEFYLGADPNPDVYITYLEQCRYYDRWRFNIESDNEDYKTPVLNVYDNYFRFYSESTGITVIIYNQPAEDIDFSEFKDFDLVFTSPPYYCLEKYAEHSRAQKMQSWYRYTTPETWLEGFLKPVVLKMKKILKNNGYMAINIIDPVVNKKRGGRVMVHDCLQSILSDMNFLGHIGLRVIKRPNIKSSGYCSEPIWVYKK